jgi:glycosidase
MLEDRFYSPKEYLTYKGRRQLFTFPWMNSSDIIKTPRWVNDTIWYQIFVDRFCNGNPDINPKDVLPWRSPDKQVKYLDYFGGDIAGITSKLDYLQDLGVTGLYLTPICKSKSNHKYDTISYTMIDPAFGTDEDMAYMVSQAHNRGIRVMMDGVFNHSGILFKPWRDVVKNGPDSKYYDWFMINSWPFKNKGYSSNARNGNYYTFAFSDNMPKLNTNNPKVIKYILKVVTSWVNKYDIDGLRLDVAGEISHTLCKELNKTLKAMKPDFYILGEMWHDSMTWLRGDEFDSVMNYPFGDSINDFWADNSKTSMDFEFAINRCYSMYTEQTNNVLFNLLDSHDTIRLISKLKDVYTFYQQLTVLFTMPGTVCIYYGTEVALEGSFDPDCRRCMPWDKINKGDYYKQISIMKSLIKLRKNHSCLRGNNYSFVNISENNRIICYHRYDDEEKICVILNCSHEDYAININKNNVLFSLGYSEQRLGAKGVIVYII